MLGTRVLQSTAGNARFALLRSDCTSSCKVDAFKSNRAFLGGALRDWKRIFVNNDVKQQVDRNDDLGKFYGTTAASSVLQEMPEARGLPVLGTILSLVTSGGAAKLHEYVDKRHGELGPVYRECIGNVRAVFVSSPNEFRKIFRLDGSRPKHLLPEAWILYNEIRECRRGLFFMDGDEWLHFRRIANKLLLKSDSGSFMKSSCQDAADVLTRRWEHGNAAMNVILPELEAQLYQWSIEVMLATLMGSLWHRHGSRVLFESNGLAENLRKIFEYSARLSLLPAKLAMTLKLPAWKRFVESVDEAMKIVRALLPEMIRLEGDGLLKMLMDEGIRNDDLLRIVADLIFAAGDTTAYSMQWALFLLASHPETQNKLFDSLKGLKQDEILRQPLLRGVLKESLRLYPTAPFLTRFLPEDSIIGNYHVSKGELLLLSLYTSGRDATNFVSPNIFWPERWIRTDLGDYEGVINPHATLPFALGARSCVGRKLAETQMILTLAKLIETFKMECVNKDRVKMILHLVSVPSEPIQLRLTRRS